MDRTPLLSYEGMKQNAVPSIYYLNILGIPFLIGIFYVIVATGDSDCNNTRLWLEIEAIVQILFTGVSIAQISKRLISKSNVLVKLPLLFLCLFQITWLALGTYWILSGYKCYETYLEGFVMVSVICLATYLAILVFLVLYLLTCIVEVRKKKH